MQKPHVVIILVLSLLVPTMSMWAETAALTTAPASKPPAASRRGARQGEAVITPVKRKHAEEAPVLPPLPEGVEELKFADFFKTPVGPRGLELTKRLQSLDGKRVRIVGFMVYEDPTACSACAGTAPKLTKSGGKVPGWLEAVIPGRMMMAPYPCGVSHAHYALCDDLPPQTVFIEVPDSLGQLVPYTPGLLALTGKLSVGNKSEPDGRISVVRLTLDTPAPAQSPKTVSNP